MQNKIGQPIHTIGDLEGSSLHSHVPNSRRVRIHVFHDFVHLYMHVHGEKVPGTQRYSPRFDVCNIATGRGATGKQRMFIARLEPTALGPLGSRERPREAVPWCAPAAESGCIPRFLALMSPARRLWLVRVPDHRRPVSHPEAILQWILHQRSPPRTTCSGGCIPGSRMPYLLRTILVLRIPLIGSLFFFSSQVDAGCSVGGSPSAVNTSYLFYGRGPAASGLSGGPRLGRSLPGARRG